MSTVVSLRIKGFEERGALPRYRSSNCFLVDCPLQNCGNLKNRGNWDLLSHMQSYHNECFEVIMQQ